MFLQMTPIKVRLNFSLFKKEQNSKLVLSNPLLDLLDAVKRTGSLTAASKELGYSYRHLWNEVKKWEKELGADLLVSGRGKNGELTPFAERLLWANKEVQAKYHKQLLDLKAGIAQTFSRAIKETWDPIQISGCPDMAIDILRQIAVDKGEDLEVNFSSSLEGLKSLNNHECDIAGFNFPLSSGKDSQACKIFSPYLNPESMAVITFATRLQGLAVPKGNPKKIYSIMDIAFKKAKFINRKEGTGTRLLFDKLLQASGLSSSDIFGYDNYSASTSMSAVAIASSRADAGICTANIAEESHLDFIPLAKEIYYLACTKEFLTSQKGTDFLSFLKDIDWEPYSKQLQGYDFPHVGEILSPEEIF